MSSHILNPETDVTASVPRPKRERREYTDKQYKGGVDAWRKKLEESSTVYVGNLSYYTNEYQLYELFTRCGSIKRIIMGLDKHKKTPCGFCFIEFDERDSALKSINHLNRHHLDGREINVNMDAGYETGREYGRGQEGGQMGDERRRRSDGSDNLTGGSGPRYSGGSMMGLQTRSFAFVACISLISIILVASFSDPVMSSIVYRPSTHYFNRYPNIASQIRYSQQKETREQFERNFAQFLVNFLKASKPSLLMEFMKATLADKSLREQALGIFFNNTETDT